MTNDEPDVLGVYWWREEDGIHYRARGIGPTYDKLYEWLNNRSSYRCTSTDWPWDFFVFDDPKDHKELIVLFGTNNVMEDTYED